MTTPHNFDPRLVGKILNELKTLIGYCIELRALPPTHPIEMELPTASEHTSAYHLNRGILQICERLAQMLEHGDSDALTRALARSACRTFVLALTGIEPPLLSARQKYQPTTLW